MRTLTLGREAELVHVVGEADGAARWGNDAPVLATPILLWLAEIASMRVLDGLLDDGELSLGTGHEAQHLAPTPIGATVTLHARLVESTGKLLRFAVEARDADEVVYRGIHERAVVRGARFRARVAAKAARLAPGAR